MDALQVRLDHLPVSGAISIQQIVFDQLKIPKNFSIRLDPVDRTRKFAAQSSFTELAELKMLTQGSGIDKWVSTGDHQITPF